MSGEEEFQTCHADGDLKPSRDLPLPLAHPVRRGSIWARGGPGFWRLEVVRHQAPTTSASTGSSTGSDPVL